MNPFYRAFLSAILAIFFLWSSGQALAVVAGNITVNTEADNLTPGDSFCTLREAIGNVNSQSDLTSGDCAAGGVGFLIDFAGDYTIVLGSALPAISVDSVLIDAADRQVTIDGAGSFRIFTINSGKQLQLSNLNLTNGNADFGGAIRNFGTLEVRFCTLSGNFATNSGGALDNSGSTAILQSTVSGNSATNGGGVFSTGELTIANSTFYNNTAIGYGGGLLDGADTYIFNSTFSNNSAGINQGGGIYSESALFLFNTILANSPQGLDCVRFAGGLLNEDVNNLIESNGSSGHQCGTPVLTDDPMLGPLQDNGGPTDTMALLPGSPAIDAGSNSECAAWPVFNRDQRDVLRPIGGQCDIGAFEFFEEIIFNSSFEFD